MSHPKSESMLTSVVCITLLVIIVFVLSCFSGYSRRSSPELVIEGAEPKEEIIFIEPKIENNLSTTERSVSIMESPVEENNVADVSSGPTGTTEVVLEVAIEVEEFDRTAPLYEIYKGGFPVEVNTDLQWYIRDMCETYNFYEKYVYGMILTESTFHADAKSEGCYGLCQINTFWIKGANITHFTEDYRDRNLLDPYDNLLTLSEMWCYARDAYNLDLMTEDGMMRVCYWHNTGKDPRYITSSSYFNYCAKYANELVPLQ